MLKYLDKNGASYLCSKFGSANNVKGNMIFKGQWNNTDTYNKYDVVVSSNLLYIALSDVAANKSPSSNPNLWQQMNYSSSYNKVSSSSNSTVYYILGSTGTGEKQTLSMASNTSNRGKFYPDTGVWDFPILKQSNKDVATKEYVDGLIGNVETLLAEV